MTHTICKNNVLGVVRRITLPDLATVGDTYEIEGPAEVDGNVSGPADVPKGVVARFAYSHEVSTADCPTFGTIRVTRRFWKLQSVEEAVVPPCS